MCAKYAGASWAIAMGDDALESVDTDLSVYKDIGLKVEVSGQLEFCFHIFEKPDLAIPVNVGKMLYKLIWLQPGMWFNTSSPELYRCLHVSVK